MTATTPHRARADARARRPRPWAVLGLLPLTLALVACSGDALPGTASSSDVAGGGTQRSTPSAAATDSTAEPPSPGPEAPPVPPGAESPQDAFRAWLAASRAPDVERACGYLAPALVDRMVAEMTSQGWPGITDCASMITTTAALYAAVGDVAEVELTVREARSDATVLAVAYAGGDCGTAVMVPAGSTWVVTEQSEEQC